MRPAPPHGYPPLSGAEPSVRDVDATVRALLAHLDAAFGVCMLLSEARAALQAEVLGWFLTVHKPRESLR